MSEHGEVQITCGSADEARHIADLLVECRLAACVLTVPIESVYEWEGSVEHDSEVLILAKTRADRLELIVETVTAEHSYDLPAITMVPMSGSAAYLAWIDDQVAAEPGHRNRT